METDNTKEKRRGIWQEEAAKILKIEFVRQGITHEELVEKLNSIGVVETVGTLRNKLYRGTFSFSFFLQCAVALNIRNLKLDELIDKMRKAVEIQNS